MQAALQEAEESLWNASHLTRLGPETDEMTALWLLSSLVAGCWLSPGEVFCDRIVWGCLEEQGEEE